MSDFWALIGTSVGGMIVTALLAWGGARAKFGELERRLEVAENEARRQSDAVHGLRDVYVSYQHFNEIMATMRESQRELREDMKKMLSLLQTSHN